MSGTKLDTELLEILNLDLKIETNILEKVTFKDENLEKLYQANIDYNQNQIFLQGDRIIILGWISILLYVYFVYFRTEVFISTVVCLAICLFLIIIKMLKKISDHKFVNILQVLLITFFLNLKIIYLNYLNVAKLENNEGEIIRTIVYDFISSNLLSLLILEENIFARILLLLFNLTSIFISILLSNSGNCYLIDALTSIFYSFIFYLLKKAWEYNLRSVFSERYCLSKLLYYSNDFIRELNGIHFNRSINKTHISGKNVREIIYESQNISEFSFERLDFNESGSDLFISNNSDSYKSFMNKLILYEPKKDDSENKKTLYKKLEEVQMSINLINKFENIGIFSNNFSKNKRYYEVFYRKFYITEFNIIDDIFFYDVSNYILAQQKINEENTIKQKVYAKISHEFKTPINSIIGLIENIKESILNKNYEGTIKYLNTIKSLSNYVIYLTNDVIQFSFSSSMRTVNIHKNIINIKEIVEFGYEILICLLNCTSKKSEYITPILNFDDSINNLIIYSDEVRLKQILLNFVSNAVKFTKSGSIIISAERIDNTQEIVLKVIDTGIGINNDDQKKLFNEFTQFHEKNINNSLGSGLGLSICKNLAEILNLKINSSSIYGTGSTFSVIIPSSKKSFNSSLELSNLTGKIIGGNSNPNTNEKVENKISKRNIEMSHLGRQKSKFLSVSPNNRTRDNIIKSKKNSNTPESKEKRGRGFYENNNLFSLGSLNNYQTENSFLIKRKFSKNYSQKEIFNFQYFDNKKILPRVDILNPKENNHFCININEKSELPEELNLLNISKNSSRNSSFLIDIEQEAVTVRIEDNPQRLYTVETLFGKKNVILTVDDNLFINQSVKSLIESIFKENNISNYEVICASDGIEMLHYLKEDQNQGNLIKCIITDENMEYMNGSHATKIIREYEKSGKIKPVNIITSTCQEDEITKMYLNQSGSQLILSKPLNKLDLINALRQFNIL